MLIGRTILVAEDEPLIRLDLTAALVDVGATVRAVADAREAFRLAAAPDLSAAVLDYNLGANNSVLVGWRLHSCDVPFLLYTGRFDLPALPWPTAPVIHKPSPMIRIVSTLASLITRGT
jgi:DNA-binding response OmpR family regulator